VEYFPIAFRNAMAASGLRLFRVVSYKPVYGPGSRGPSLHGTVSARRPYGVSPETAGRHGRTDLLCIYRRNGAGTGNVGTSRYRRGGCSVARPGIAVPRRSGSRPISRTVCGADGPPRNTCDVNGSGRPGRGFRANVLFGPGLSGRMRALEVGPVPDHSPGTQ